MASFYKANSLISHAGPIPLNWSRVQGKLFRHECIEHPAQYSVAKTQFIINVSKKLTNETWLRYISTIKHWLHLKWYASERPPSKVNTTVLTWLSKENIVVFFFSLHFKVSTATSKLKAESRISKLERIEFPEAWIKFHGSAYLQTLIRKYNLGKILGLWHPGQGCGKESYKQRKGACLLTFLNWTWTLTMLACSQTLYFSSKSVECAW